MDTTTEEIIIRHTLPLDKNTPSDHSGSDKTSEAEMQHGAIKDPGLESSENIENKRRFKEALQKSFPLCKGSIRSGSWDSPVRAVSTPSGSLGQERGEGGII